MVHVTTYFNTIWPQKNAMNQCEKISQKHAKHFRGYSTIWSRKRKCSHFSWLTDRRVSNNLSRSQHHEKALVQYRHILKSHQLATSQAVGLQNINLQKVRKFHVLFITAMPRKEHTQTELYQPAHKTSFACWNAQTLTRLVGAQI